MSWISDEVWRAWGPRPPREAGPSPIDEPSLVAATEGDRDRAPTLETGGAPVPPAGTGEDAARLLARTPPSDVGIRSPVWPLCCGRPATVLNAQGLGLPLSAIEARTGPLDRAYLEQELREGWGARTSAELATLFSAGFRDALARMRARGFEDGVAIYHCRACGRVYVASCHP